MGMRGQTERGKKTENVGNLGSGHGWPVGTPLISFLFLTHSLFFFFAFFLCLLFDRGLQVREDQVEQEQERRKRRKRRNGEELEKMGKRVIGRDNGRLAMFE